VGNLVAKEERQKDRESSAGKKDVKSKEKVGRETRKEHRCARVLKKSTVVETGRRDERGYEGRDLVWLQKIRSKVEVGSTHSVSTGAGTEQRGGEKSHWSCWKKKGLEVKPDNVIGNPESGQGI